MFIRPWSRSPACRRKAFASSSRDGRRLWRQRRISLDACLSRCVAGHEVRTPGKDDLRPHGRHGGHHQAASLAHPASHGGQRRRQTARRRNRLRHRWRRLCHLIFHRALAWHHPRRRPLFWPNIRVNSKAYATNTPPHGAFRGFGAPQSLFALERHMDHIAKTIGMAPDEFRRRNLLRQGMTTATNQVINEPIVIDQMLDSALELTGYHAKVKPIRRTQPDKQQKKGIGIATFLHGAGFTGSGERYLNALVGLEATAAGGIAGAGIKYGIRPGNKHDPLPDCGRNPGPRVRRRQHGSGRYQHLPQQRSHGGLAHRDDHRQDCPDCRVEDAPDFDRQRTA